MSLEVEIESLGKIPMFSCLDEEALRILAFSADPRSLKSGDTLLRRGERSDGGYFVVSGSLIALADDQDDRGKSVIPAGALIGEMAMITPTENPATIIAREATNVMRMPRALFQRLLREYPGSSARLRGSI
jgi:CRP-like cAMP-binding protein